MPHSLHHLSRMAAPEELQPQWLPLKTAADSLYKGGHFAQAAAAYSSLLNTWQGKMPPQDVNKVMGNRCLASQKAGEPLQQSVVPAPALNSGCWVTVKASADPLHL